VQAGAMRRLYWISYSPRLVNSSPSRGADRVAARSGWRVTRAASAGTSFLPRPPSPKLRSGATACTGSGFARLDLAYDGEGHRTRLLETTAGGTPVVTTTEFTYEGDTVVRETSTTGGTTITRAFTTDETGAIVKVAISGDPTSLHNGTYLVTHNGHGDALALEKIESSGALTPANRYTYNTWGTPTTTTHNGYGDLRFRYLYVGQYGVTWDSSAAVPSGIHYMRARHYHAEFGRFIQPDPSALEANLYGYAANSPVTKVDPDGTKWWELLRDLWYKVAPHLSKLGTVGPRALALQARWAIRANRDAILRSVDRVSGKRGYSVGGHSLSKHAGTRAERVGSPFAKVKGSPEVFNREARRLVERILKDQHTVRFQQRTRAETIYVVKDDAGRGIRLARRITGQWDFIGFWD
jgi:RHS repeat-associated protein